MTLISVGVNIHDLPDEDAVRLYEVYSRGSEQGNKVFARQEKGTMKLELQDNGR
jgi:hypothetical protein